MSRTWLIVGLVFILGIVWHDKETKSGSWKKAILNLLASWGVVIFVLAGSLLLVRITGDEGVLMFSVGLMIPFVVIFRAWKRRKKML